MAVALILGVFVGAVLGLTGAGGGILAVPALVFGLGWPMQQAAPVALIAVAFGAAVGAVEGWRRRLVRYKAAALMAAAGIATTSLGLRAAHALPQRALLALFASAMLIVAWRMHGQARAGATVSAPAPPLPARMSTATGKLMWTRGTAAVLAGVGALTGVLTGLLGVGGGFVIVPLLRRYSDIPMHGIVATSLLVIALVGGGGVLNALLHGVVVPTGPALAFAVATGGGMLAGRRLGQRLSGPQVQRAFAAALLIVALGLLGKAATGG